MSRAARASLGLAALLLAAGGLPGPLDAHARPATGGSGRFHDSIDWFEWGTHLQTISGATQTRTNTISAGGADARRDLLAVGLRRPSRWPIAPARSPGLRSTTSTTSAAPGRRTR